MFQKRFLWKIFFTNLLLISLSLIIFGIYSTREFKDFYYTQTSGTLESKASSVRDELRGIDLETIDPHFLDKYGKITDVRITLIDPSGKVLADSKENAGGMENHRDRPEFETALKGGIGSSIRFSHTIQRDLMYVAIPVYDITGKNVSAVIRTSVAIAGLDEPLGNIYVTLGVGGLIILAIITLISYFISRSISRPLTDIKNAAERFTKGDFKQKIYPRKQGELSELAESLNTMSEQIDEKLSIINEQKNVQQAVLESMKEGVLAVDYDEKILLINKAAEEILFIDESAKGKTLQEGVRFSDIQKFFRKLIEEGKPVESELIIRHGTERTLQLSGSVLRDIGNNPIGSLVVFNDITSLKHLDSLKRDLVANVSHELKTPITTIKGFVETLKEGNFDKPEERNRFLEIVSKNTDRLNAIIEDLLSLSRLEQMDANNTIKFEELELKPLIESIAENFHFKAAEKNISIKIQCEDGTKAKMNRALIEQAVGNLIDNAIKYSDENKTIRVYVIKEMGKLIISVEDEGFGISSEHIPRLFERFYRVDKSRSRDEGGTGLGLAIVKHIVQVHNGTISVESSPGKGSNFIIKIPSA